MYMKIKYNIIKKQFLLKEQILNQNFIFELNFNKAYILMLKYYNGSWKNL